MRIFTAPAETPIGILQLSCREEGVCRIAFTGESAIPSDFPATGSPGDAPSLAEHRWIREARKQLAEYFQQKRRKFVLPLTLEGTAFQESVWNAILKVPYGTTLSYRELAARIGRPEAVRAVGAAVGSNPIPIIVPCHRTLGSNGRLTGFAGGLKVKERLLELEGSRIPFG